MVRSRKLMIAGVAVVALGAGGVGLAQAVGGDDEQATGPDADRAKAAAVEAAGGGRAVSVERDQEGNRTWEVEVRKADGSTAEVDLSGELKQVGAERDDDDSGERDDGDAGERDDGPDDD